MAMVSGWGSTWVRNRTADKTTLEVSRFLMTTEVTCLDLDKHCKVFELESYENSTICAGNLRHNNTGSWFGDSGGSYISLF